MDLKDKKVAVIGLGNSGVNAALLLKDAGADVWATDSQETDAVKKSAGILKGKNINVELGGHSEEFIKGSTLVVVSPGVEDSSAAVKWAMKSSAPIISEMELGFRFCKGRIIGITGTNGKSTVTTLIGEMLKRGTKDAVVCGNIGNSLCGEISRIKETTWVVLEVSSFQLERIEDFKPHIAVILNITDDHMDRYSDFRKYFNEKLRIFYNQDEDDFLVLNYDAENLRNLKGKTSSRVMFYSALKKTDGSYVENGRIYCVSGGKTEDIGPVGDVRLKGIHNIENVLASALVAKIIGVKGSSIKEAIRSFKGLPHRFETVEEIDGVEYIDDSKGTTVDSTCRALESCEKPVILIAGGKDKNSDYSVARDIVKKKVSHLILIGEAKHALRGALEGAVGMTDAKDMSDAVDIASGLAKSGEIVLLSPMCSSFDMFKDYKERGEVFKKAVRSLEDSRERVKSR